MTALALRFPAGRFHATPWGRHVNEGAIEWPPSPWRILRALIATWHWKAKTEVGENTMRCLCDKLGAAPTYHLPPATASHTRHYMPVIEGKNEKKAKIFDAFVQMSPADAVVAVWDVELETTESVALSVLAARLAYFGRAESLVLAEVLASPGDLDAMLSAAHRESAPLASTDPLPAGHDLIRVLAPMPSAAYANWRADFTARALADLGPKPTAQQRKRLPTVPDDLFAALQADTGDLQAAGWNLPPGAEFVNYARPEGAFSLATKPRGRAPGPLPTVARYALTSTVPPPITKALAVAEQLHDILCSKRYSDGHPTFTGCENEVERKGHRHAHIFCESIGATHGHITHVTVFAPEGFDDTAQAALRKLQWAPGFQDHELRTVLHGLGTPGDLPDCVLFGRSATWRSLTPFVSTRFAKVTRDGRPKLDSTDLQPGSAKHDLRRLLEQHRPDAFEKVVSINEIGEADLPYQFGNRSFRSLQFNTHRRRGDGRRGNGNGSAFTITFSEPVSGPLAFGYGSHFGLGLFVPVDVS